MTKGGVMKRALGLFLLFSFLLGLAVAASARESASRVPRFMQSSDDERYILGESVQADHALSAAVDTYLIVRYDFEYRDWQGWTQLDRTAQLDTFWHVEDYLEPELAGLPGPLDGTKSAWCGAPPGAQNYLCQWVYAPGYGNRWNQTLTSDVIYFEGCIDFSFHGYFDSERGYDFTYLEYDTGNDTWQRVDSYDSTGVIDAAYHLPVPMVKTKLRFRFVSDVAWSDEDGVIDTKGAAHIDEITVADVTGVLNFEDFESAADMSKSAGIWHCGVMGGYGLYSGLVGGLSDKDPCNDNMSYQIVFFIGSPYPSTSYPGLFDTPFCKGTGGKGLPCQDEMVVSPLIDLAKYSTGQNDIQDASIPPEDLPNLGGAYLRFTVYGDLPVENCVYYNWQVRSIDPAGCPGRWATQDFINYGDGSYQTRLVNIARYIDFDNPLQISLGVFDYCYAWGTTSCSCSKHTPAPWFDNVSIQRFITNEPQWTVAARELFQDNFPSEEWVLESYVRADMAMDVNSAVNPVIRPGDSVVVWVASPLGGGIALDPGGGPAVYMHVMCSYIGHLPSPKPSYIDGAILQGTYGTYKSTAAHWNIIQCDSARYGGTPIPDAYCVDLNDSLFTRGYEIQYYFTACTNAGVESAAPRYARSGPPYYEFTCLPTMNSNVLFVDDADGRGSFRGTVEDYWNATFPGIFYPDRQPDRYDVNAPSSGLSNGPGSRAWNAVLTGNGMGDWEGYYTIVWDSGDLWTYTICDGTDDKSDDISMLIDWMDLSGHRTGLWVCGDNIAYELHTLNHWGGAALMQTWCGMDYEADSYLDVTGGLADGGIASPLITGDADLGLFIHGGFPDSWYAFGGCPIINRFDVIKKMLTGKTAATYPVYNSTVQPAAVGNRTLNTGGFDVRTLWFGFSYQYVRDDVSITPLDRFHIARDVFAWMQYYVPYASVLDENVPRAYKLSQNFPNPFNPRTSIEFDMKEKGLVTVRVYNVAGQLVRSLIDGVKDAGAYSVTWDGTNNLGVEVGSGIYFSKMETREYSATKKLVLLR